MLGELASRFMRTIRGAGLNCCASCCAPCALKVEVASQVLASSLKTAAELGVLPEDNEGLIDHLRAIRGVIVAVFFEELPDGRVRVSMRSKSEKTDVCAICQKFGGGGHTLAAGARVRGSLAEVEQKILGAICNVVGCDS